VRDPFTLTLMAIGLIGAGVAQHMKA